MKNLNTIVLLMLIVFTSILVAPVAAILVGSFISFFRTVSVITVVEPVIGEEVEILSEVAEAAEELQEFISDFKVEMAEVASKVESMYDSVEVIETVGEKDLAESRAKQEAEYNKKIVEIEANHKKEMEEYNLFVEEQIKKWGFDPKDFK